jgi:hypothetical protein
MKPIIFWLAAVTAMLFCILAFFTLAGKHNYFHSKDLVNPADTITRPGALFIDSIQITGFETNATAKYKNLQVYTITGDEGINDKKYTCLQHALDTKMVIVRETGDVNELKIDNLSGDFVYINSGDIVKGGRQDRTIQFDVIIPPYKKDMDLASFCVEHGRWSKRGNEEDHVFAMSESSLSSKELKIAAKHSKSQQEVWDKVSKYQRKANEELNKAAPPNRTVDVRSTVSESSLQLTLDDEEIKQSKAAYRQELAGKLKNIPDATGLAYCINGKLYSLDIYNNHQLFADLFDKLLDAAITEAISEAIVAGIKDPEPELGKMLAARAKVYEDKDVNEITRFQSSESGSFKDLVIFTTIDKSNNKWLHRNWIDKTEE